jgi:AcrR family transcriptional regulator
MILHAGRDVFAQHGFRTPRVEDVARAAGISRATFYLHFDSLEELIQAVFEREVRYQLRRYRGLTAEVLANERAARGWLEHFFASFRRERQYIRRCQTNCTGWWWLSLSEQMHRAGRGSVGRLGAAACLVLENRPVRFATSTPRRR